MGITERRERDKAEMRDKICRAAMKLFLTEGFERTSIRRIAEAIEYTPGAIYSYFKDKDAILYALHEEGFDKLFAMQIAEPLVADPFERLVRCGQVYLRFALENPQYYDLMFIMSETGKQIGDDEHDWLKGVRAYDFLRAIVKDCIDAGRLPIGDPEAAAFAMWASAHGLAALLIRQRCVMIPEDQREPLVRAAMKYTMTAIERTAL